MRSVKVMLLGIGLILVGIFFPPLEHQLCIQ